jgi:hypothetical protein
MKPPSRLGARPLAAAALACSLLALVLSMTGVSEAVRKGLFPGASTKPKPYGVLRLDKRKKFPPSVFPKVRAARRADRIGGKRASDIIARCAPDTVDFGSWCLMNAPYGVTNKEVGQNNYFFATQKCVDLGGYLPTAAQLVGAAGRVKLASTIDDSRLTASIDLDRTDGFRDRREMSSTLITTAAGSTAAGSQGVTEGSRGDPRQGEPDPVPQPSNPNPQTLQYVTVYDNGDKGGFAGGKPVGSPELFRCAFNKSQGQAADEVG